MSVIGLVHCAIELLLQGRSGPPQQVEIPVPDAVTIPLTPMEETVLLEIRRKAMQTWTKVAVKVNRDGAPSNVEVVLRMKL